MRSASSSPPQVLWLNGRFLPEHEAAVSPLDRGFLYGDGLFETMRAQQGEILYPDNHIERLHQSLEKLRITLTPKPPWIDISRELMRQNALTKETASVKVIVSRGECPGMGLPTSTRPTVCITARQYAPPTDAAYRQGWSLHIYDEGFSPPLAAHKTLNYLYYAMARQSAMDAGANEALIFDPHHRVTETSAGSVLARTNGRWWTPASPFQLPGTTIREVSKILLKDGRPTDSRPANLNDLLSAETVWILNSMMIIMPVSQIGNHPVPDPSAEEAAHLRLEFIREGLKGRKTF